MKTTTYQLTKEEAEAVDLMRRLAMCVECRRHPNRKLYPQKSSSGLCGYHERQYMTAKCSRTTKRGTQCENPAPYVSGGPCHYHQKEAA